MKLARKCIFYAAAFVVMHVDMGQETGVYAQSADSLPLEQITLPPGFSIELYAKVPGARSLALGAQGTVFVGNGGFSNPGTSVYALTDADKDGNAEQVVELVTGLDNPNGVAFMRVIYTLPSVSVYYA